MPRCTFGTDAPETMSRVALPSDELTRATGAQNEHLQLRRLREVLNTVILSGFEDEGEATEKAVSAVLASLARITPLDELEGMLAAQMVATHNTAMECLRRSMLPEQGLEGRQDSLKHAVKFLNLYTRQLEALDRHRGNGLRKITVDNVQVHAGGQAIVGHVNAKDGTPEEGKAKPPGIAHSPSPVMQDLSDASAAMAGPVAERNA